MKLTMLICLMSVFGVVATNGYAQITKLTIKMERSSVEEVLREIENQSEYRFFYNGIIDVDRKITVYYENRAISEVLKDIFASSGVEYKMMGRQIMLSPAIQEMSPTVSMQPKGVTGKITDDKGEPLFGVTIVIKNTTNGVISDGNGEYAINASPGDVLQISYIGYKTKEIVVGSQNSFDVVMEEDLLNLDEVMVVGYSTNTKRALISSVSTVETEQLKNIPVTNMTQGLAGRSPGLIVQASGGGVGKISTISIRGGDTPLVVIDGIIRDYVDFVNLSSEDIGSFSILKDASATAVYGARAANGILQITTKKGSTSELPKVDFSVRTQWAQPGIFPNKLSSYEQAYYTNMAYRNSGSAPIYTDQELQLYKDGSDPWNYPNTDWQGLVLKNFATTKKYNVSVSGGKETNTYYFSLGYIDEGSLYKVNSHFQKRTNFRLSNSSLIKSIGLRTTASLDGYLESNRHPYSSTASNYFGIFSHVQNKSPMGVGVNEYGLAYAGTVDNPYREIQMDNGYIKNWDRTINGNLTFEWALPWVEGLKLRTSANYRFYADEYKSWQKDAPAAQLGESEPSDYGMSPKLYKSNDNGWSYTMQYFGEYARTFKEKHHINLLFGYENSYTYETQLFGQRINYNFYIDQFVAGPTEDQSTGGSENESARAGYVGQLRYSYENKYFLEGSFRHDGSDKFAKGKRWGTFFSGSLGWLVSDEFFFQTLKDHNILNSLKLRASYGEVGLDEGISSFAYLSSYSYNSRAYVVNGEYVNSFTEGALASPDLTWYTTKQTNVGMDFASLSNHLYGSLDYFYYATNGYLGSPSETEAGYTAPLGLSLPQVKTDSEKRRAGWEFQLGYQNRIGNLEYNIKGNFTYFDELWAKDANETTSSVMNPYKRTSQQKGYYGIGYICEGFYESHEDVLNSPRRSGSTDLAPGDLKYKDFNGDGKIDGSDQVRIGHNSFPRGNYGLMCDLKYRGFSFSMLWQGATSYDMYLGTLQQGNGQTSTTPFYKYQLDFWTPENTNAKFPRLLSSANNNNTVSSDFWLVDGRYIRLKDLSLGYDFKKTMLRGYNWLSHAEIVLSGQNLLTFSKSKDYGLDPENGSVEGYAYPLERIYSISINLGF